MVVSTLLRFSNWQLNSIQPESRRRRSLFGDRAYVEGWAEYIAEVMMDEGYLNHDSRFR
jgi:uncharacterized protein (DUF885 family)